MKQVIKNYYLRYYEDESASPLWINEEGKIKLEDIPKCPLCNENRKLEFQVKTTPFSSLILTFSILAITSIIK